MQDIYRPLVERSKETSLFIPFLLADAWVPRYNTIGQYIQVDLLEEQPLYGIILSGSVYMESYTTTFNILYSSDDYTFSYITDHDVVQVKAIMVLCYSSILLCKSGI